MSDEPGRQAALPILHLGLSYQRHPRCHPPTSGKGRERAPQQISFSLALEIGDVGSLGELPGPRRRRNGKQLKSQAVQTWLFISRSCTPCHGSRTCCSRTGRDLHPAAGDISVGLPVSANRPPGCGRVLSVLALLEAESTTSPLSVTASTNPLPFLVQPRSLS